MVLHRYHHFGTQSSLMNLSRKLVADVWEAAVVRERRVGGVASENYPRYAETFS